MSYNPYARYTYGGSLYHGRKAIADGGARNGYSNTPGYRPIGKKAISRIVGYDRSGHPIYAYTNAGPTPWSASQQRKNAQIAQGSDARDAALRNLNQQRTQSDQRVTRKVNERKLAAGAAKREQDLRNSPAKTTKADTKVKNYNNSPLKPINEAKNKAGSWLNTARKNVGNWFDRRGEEVRNFANNAIDAVSNRDERAAMERAREAYRTNPTEANKKAYRNAVNAYQNHGLTRAERKVKDIGDNVGLTARNASRNVRNAARTVGKNVTNWANERGNDIRNFDAKKFIDDTIRNTKKAADNVKTAVNKKEAELNYKKAQKEALRLSNAMEKYSPNDPKFYEAQQEYSAYLNSDEYRKALATWNAYK